MAVESKDTNEVINTVKQIVTNCIVSGNIDLDKTPFYDVDYLFIFLRAKSIGESIDVKLTCNNTLEDGRTCNNVFDADMNISNCEIVKDETVKDDIRLDGRHGIIMKYPSYATIKRLESNINYLTKMW